MTIDIARERRTTSARWEDALDAQLEAYLFATSERGRRYLDGWVESSSTRSQKYGDAADKRYAKFLATGTADIAASLFNAEPVHIDPDMMTLWESACDGFVEEPLHESDLLTDVGFVYLPRPHSITDIHGTKTNHRAYLWVRIKDGIVLFLLHQLGDVDGYDTGKGMQTPTVMRGYGALHRGDLIVDGMFPWKFGDSPQYRGTTAKGTPMTHDVQVLFRLLQQTITTRERGRPTRPVRRRMKHAGFPERNVVVVRLRRPTTPTGDGDAHSVEWSHRWLVEGHWRNQWFPSLGIHRQIRINGYVKGPADLPLQVRKTRIFDWSR